MQLDSVPGTEPSCTYLQNFEFVVHFVDHRGLWFIISKVRPASASNRCQLSLNILLLKQGSFIIRGPSVGGWGGGTYLA